MIWWGQFLSSLIHKAGTDFVIKTSEKTFPTWNENYFLTFEELHFTNKNISLIFYQVGEFLSFVKFDNFVVGRNQFFIVVLYQEET